MIEITKYVKKPVVIEAVLLPTLDGVTDDVFREVWTPAAAEIAVWCGGHREAELEQIGIIIPTLEGDHLAKPGDFIIKGVQGEFYPCKPDIFEQTYSEWADGFDSQKEG